jgi:hypothetical protein
MGADQSMPMSEGTSPRTNDHGERGERVLVPEITTITLTYITIFTMDFSAGPQLGAAIPHKSAVTLFSYHGDGVHLFAATEADSKLYLINTQTGKCDQPAFKCEREGISKVSAT